MRTWRFSRASFSAARGDLRQNRIAQDVRLFPITSSSTSPSLHLLSATSSHFSRYASWSPASPVALPSAPSYQIAKAPEKPLVSVEPAAYAKELGIVVLATTSKEETPLVKHVKRLLLERQAF